MMYSIVNGQNLQIQAMYDYLDAKRLPEKDNCDVYIDTVSENIVFQSATSGASHAAVTNLALFGMGTVWFLGTFFYM